MHPMLPVKPRPLPTSQQGVVLITALIILMAMTIVSVTTMTSSSLEERMAGNMKDREIAFQAAEAALRYGERLAQAGINTASFDTSCTGGYCNHDLQAAGTYDEYWTDATLDVWNDNGKHQSYNVTFAEVNTQPKFIIEYMGKQIQDFSAGPQGSDPPIYRITALGTGQSDNSRVMLQSTFIKQ